jgi:hypothetical protein
MTPSNDVATIATRNTTPANGPAHTHPAAAAPAPVGIGIDVAKDKLDLARTDAPGRCLTIANDPAGIAQPLAAAPPATAIVLESTGGLERPLLDALLDARLPVALVNPGKIRHFAKGLGILAKTDAVDAAVLAPLDYAQGSPCSPTTASPNAAPPTTPSSTPRSPAADS